MRDGYLDVYIAIVKFISEEGYPPSYAELAKLLGYNSSSSIAWRVDKLVEAGLLKKVPGKNRSAIPNAKNIKKAQKEKLTNPES